MPDEREFSYEKLGPPSAGVHRMRFNLRRMRFKLRSVPG
jgi:hypothetical protein